MHNKKPKTKRKEILNLIHKDKIPKKPKIIILIKKKIWNKKNKTVKKNKIKEIYIHRRKKT